MATIPQTKTYKKVKRQIEAWVIKHADGTPDFTRWYCGITRNTEKRKTAHKRKYEDLYFFNDWYVHSLEIASALESHFHVVKGMKDKDLLGGVKDDSWYIYVFKANPNIIDLLFREP